MKHIISYLPNVALIVLMAVLFNSCEKENTGPTISRIRSNAPNADSVVSKIAPGDWIVVEGTGLSDIVSVAFDGIPTSFNGTFATGTMFTVQVPADLPLGTILPENLNKLKIVTKAGEVTYTLPILPAAPQFSISNEFAKAGEVVQLTGANFFAVTKVVFPGGISASNFSSNDGGTICTVTVPAGITLSGAITVTALGGVGSSAPLSVFNDNASIGTDFSDPAIFSTWGNAVNASVTNGTAYPSIPSLAGNYLHWKEANISASTWYCGDLTTFMSSSLLHYSDSIKLTDSATYLALKFETNTPIGLNTGRVEFNFNGGPSFYWKPWFPSSTSTRTSLPAGKWYTQTVPLSNITGLTTYNDIKGKELRMFFVNPDVYNGGGIALPQLDIGYDNFRVVKIR